LEFAVTVTASSAGLMLVGSELREDF